VSVCAFRMDPDRSMSKNLYIVTSHAPYFCFSVRLFIGSATEGFLVGEIDERRLEIRISGRDGTLGVNEVIHSSY